MLTSPIRASKGLLTSWRELNRELFGKRQGCNGYGIGEDGVNKLKMRKRGMVDFERAGGQEGRKGKINKRTKNKKEEGEEGRGRGRERRE
jgi:hypothetical protein